MWEFSLGELAGDIAIPHFASIQRIARAFAGNFIDEDNTVQNQVRPPPLPDVTFLQVKTKTLNLNVWCAGSAVNLAVPQGLAVHFNDYASEGALSRVRIRAPLVQARGLLPTLAAPWIEVVHCEFAVSVNVTITSVDWKDRETRQQQFLAEQDSLTSRCRFLYRSEPDVAQQGWLSSTFSTYKMHTNGPQNQFLQVRTTLERYTTPC